MTTSVSSTERGRSREFVAPIGGATHGRLVLDRGTPDLDVAADPSLRDLVRASFRGPLPEVSATEGTVIVHYPGFGPVGWLFRSWRARGDIALNPVIPWAVELRGGVHRLRADLRSLILDTVAIRGGVGGAELWLPRPRGTLSVEFAGGVNSVSIHRPHETPVRLSIRGGISSLSFDAEQFGSIGRGIRRQTAGWAEATDRLEVSIAGGVNHLDITS